MGWPSCFGWIFTGIWGLAAFLIGWFQWDALWNMSPNEWGDFLAGVAAPPALVWLIAGYFQHTKEVHLQTQELQHHVEEAQRLATHAGHLLEREEERENREALPELFSGRQTISNDGAVVEVQNRGSEARGLLLDHSVIAHEVGIQIQFPPIFERGQTAHIRMSGPTSLIAWPVSFGLTCYDKLGRRLSLDFNWHDGYLEQINARPIVEDDD